MDPPLVNESSFSAANPSAYSLAEIWPFGAEPGCGGLGLRMGNLCQNLGGFGESSANRDGSVESTVTEQSGGGGGGGGEGARKRRDLSSEEETSKVVSTSSANGLNNSNGKRNKTLESRDENGTSKAEVVEASSAAGNKPSEQSIKLFEQPKQDYIHVRARRGQATDSHSLAERARRERISERMNTLQHLVPGCNKVIGKALVLDEIINYIQSLQHQVEFLSMKLETINSRMSINPTIEGFPPKDLGPHPVDVTGMIFGAQATRGYAQGSQHEWLHMQVGGSFDRAS